jgi:hypothetical protein
MDKQREEFEKSYRIPDNLMFDGWEYIPKTTGGNWEQAREYTMRYQAWQAAQAAMQPEIKAAWTRGVLVGQEESKLKITELEADKARLREALVWIGKQDSSIHFIKMRERALEAIAATSSTWLAEHDAEERRCF